MAMALLVLLPILMVSPAMDMAMARGRLSLLMALDLVSATEPLDTFTPPPSASAMESMARGLLMLSLLMESAMESATVPGLEVTFTLPPSATAMVFMARGPPMPLMVMVTSGWPGATRW